MRSCPSITSDSSNVRIQSVCAWMRSTARFLNTGAADPGDHKAEGRSADQPRLSGRLSAAGLCMPGLSGHRIHRYCQVPLSGKRDRDLSLLPVQSPADSRKREFCPFQSGLLLRRLYGRIHRTNTEREYEKHSQYRQGFCQKL